ncbi:hypothetical protein HHI36_021116 [Cryptolaemus montrouzieri]|uniref:Transmembrane protein n=1 Tax=Cryptolaemus montrouzieri TaxID=559131 RepID=A0ABD2MVZ2_9CUCU
METTPVKNLTNFIKYNPPLTLLTIFVLTLTITTYSLAFYAHHKNGLLDTDVLLDTFLLKKDIENEQITITASVPIKNVNNIAPNITQVDGLINLEGFRWTCPIEAAPKYLLIRFSISDRSQDGNVCVQLIGPRRILGNLLTTSCQSNYRDQVNTGILETKPSTGYGNFCSNGTIVHFDFERTENSEKFALFIPKDAQTSVSESLMWCAYILLVIFLIVILVVIFHNNPEKIRAEI